MTKNKLDYFPDNFQDFALMPRFEENIAFLKEMAEEEDWSYKNTPSSYKYPILRNYIQYTYQRIAKEKKIAVSTDKNFACWNTGLVTPNQEPIYILFEKNKLDDSIPYWHFKKFLHKGEFELKNFSSIPEMAHYCDDPSYFVFDTRKELRLNLDHIIADNKKRFPEELQSMSDFGLKNLLKGAIDSSIERAKRNYKFAIPQYYQGSIQLLLPLCLQDPKKADLALAIEQLEDFYRVSTCLTLDMAYNNARQLARPDRDWLEP